LYVCGGRHAGGPQTGFGGPDFLLRFLEYIGVHADAGGFQIWQGVGCRMYSHRRVSDGRYWCYWSITDDETALLVSYTCPKESADDEADAVEGMVRSIRLYGTSAAS
jgi:hypothetical protein